MNPTIERVVGRAVIDEAFRRELLDDPEGTIIKLGINGFEEEVQALKLCLEKAKVKTPSHELDQMFEIVNAQWAEQG